MFPRMSARAWQWWRRSRRAFRWGRTFRWWRFPPFLALSLSPIDHIPLPLPSPFYPPWPFASCPTASDTHPAASSDSGTATALYICIPSVAPRPES